MGFTLPQSAKPMIDFAVHVVVGAFGFLVILSVAVAISAFVKAIDGMVPAWVQHSADFAEIALFALDLFLFALFVVSEAVKLVRGLWKEWRI